MTSPQEKAAAARKAAEEAARIAAEAAAAAEAAEAEAAAAESGGAAAASGGSAPESGAGAAGAGRATAGSDGASGAAGDAAGSGSAAEPAGESGAAPSGSAGARGADGGSSAAQDIAAGYAVEGAALELGTVVVDGTVDPTARVRIPLRTMNRHGLVAGATGTGKTKTLQGIAEQLSRAGVPVVLADVKGDLSGLSRPGEQNEKLAQRAVQTAATDWAPTGFPTEFVSLGTGGLGVPIRATITSFGPILLSKVLGLNETQESTLGLIFHWADKQGLGLLDLKDLRAVIQHLTSPEGKADLQGIGGVSASTAGVILRALVNLEADGGDTFFGEPELDPADLLRTEGEQGVITLFELGAQAARPAMFSTFLMWVLADLFQTLPEVGDVDKPELVFIFDEAHLLFADASKAFLDQVEQTVKLIRSKGVGVFFCTQLPTDIPNAVLSQLGARIQHALRAFTPDDQKALSKTVRTYPKTDTYDLEQALTSLGIGEAIVTVLSERGAPTPVAWTRIQPPRSLMDTIGADAIKSRALASALHGKYGQTVDRESAYEMLAANVAAAEPESEPQPVPGRSPSADEDSAAERIMKNPAVKSFLRSAATVAGREITRSLFGTRRRR
ncbi:helicase HerA-like domain-containing protein [Nocardia cyriacigeorgica]|uniref:Ornithine/acetylornithine aminotransferase n=1 Tax=Nocardia cyriacigeorgica TaxID=135487 RepID=A0A4V6ID20_9NOCA|nr:helicase HerA-like domain-containing protein [Nocardia cyriacigeorgica]VFB01764.1 Ornithine/acetylornithine aminotransferase [Nocardia cyriacigeorgica]